MSLSFYKIKIHIILQEPGESILTIKFFRSYGISFISLNFFEAANEMSLGHIGYGLPRALERVWE
jgi:hypothetical protein